MIQDRPKRACAEDLFGFAPHARAFAQAIATAPNEQFAAAVFGAAGTGKTCFLNFMAEELQALDAAVVAISANQAARNRADSEAVRRHFKGKIERVQESAAEKGLFLLVDELDQCLPADLVAAIDVCTEPAVRDRCVPVFAGNRAYLEHSISSFFGMLAIAAYGRQYLDRLVLKQFDMPPISQSRLLGAYSDCLERLQLRKPNINMLLAASDGNPRRMIRLLNALEPRHVPEAYQSDDLSGELPSLWERAHTFATCLRICFPDAYSTCALNADVCERGLDLLAAHELLPEDQSSRGGIPAFEAHFGNISLRRFLRRVAEITDIDEAPWKAPLVLQEAIEVVEA